MNGTTAAGGVKVLDKIAAYHDKQKQQESSPSTKLPALSLEFFPPKTQDGVVVRR